MNYYKEKYKEKTISILNSVKKEIEGIKHWNNYKEPDAITKEKNKHTSNPIFYTPLGVMNQCSLQINMEIESKELALKILKFIEKNDINITNYRQEVNYYINKINLDVRG